MDVDILCLNSFKFWPVGGQNYQLSNDDQAGIFPPKARKFLARGEEITQQIIPIHHSTAVIADLGDVLW